MLKAAGWFVLGYVTARYLILKNGSEAYAIKESQVLHSGQDKIEDLREEYLPEY